MARFEREAKLLASLNHPNIATIHGLEETDGKRFLVMELVEGETLAERIGRGPLPIEQTLEVCLQIAEGVEAAHEKGIIHRDLKPANVKLTPEGKVKILDFGLAKAFRDEPAGVDPSQSPTITDQMTRPGVIMGTATYMSPEQARGKPADKRADIWAFGCILYESLTGKRAFEGETVTEIVAAILKGEPNWQALPAATPWRIKDLLRRCLKKDPKERLHDVADARIEIQEAAAQPAEIVTAARRPSFLWFAAIATIILLAGFAAWGWLRSHGGSGARQALHLPLSVKNPPRLRDIWGAGFALSRDGTRITYLTSSGWQLLDLVSGTSREITHEWQGEHAEFSPRGDSIIIRTGNYIGQLVQISLSTGNAKVLLTRAAGGEMHWQDDGWIYFGRQFGIVRVREQGEAVEELLMPDLARDNWLAVNPVPLPGGRAVIFTATAPVLGSPATRSVSDLPARRSAADKRATGMVSGGWIPPRGPVDGAVFAAP
jgi:serine/threonine-protein kinase